MRNVVLVGSCVLLVMYTEFFRGSDGCLFLIMYFFIGWFVVLSYVSLVFFRILSSFVFATVLLFGRSEVGLSLVRDERSRFSSLFIFEYSFSFGFVFVFLVEYRLFLEGVEGGFFWFRFGRNRVRGV